MKIEIDTECNILTCREGESEKTMDLYSDAAFEILSEQWLRVGWNQKYPYCFSWFGRPFIQAPEDVLRCQEVIYRIKPDVIIETGVAHGGGLIFYASLLKAMDKDEARVIGVDVEIRPHNREAIEAHELFPFIELIEGDSKAESTVAEATRTIREDDTVLVILDSCHTREHVAAELEAYHRFVSVGSYIVATDGSMKDLHDVPRGDPSWKEDHPAAAARDFADRHDDFVLEQPEWPFNESTLSKNITHWPDAYLRRLR